MKRRAAIIVLTGIMLTGCSSAPTTNANETLTTQAGNANITTAGVPEGFTKIDASNACTDKIVEMYQPDGQSPTYRIHGDIEEQNGGWYMEGIVIWASGEAPSDFECLAKPGNPPTAYPVVDDYRTINKLDELLREN